MADLPGEVLDHEARYPGARPVSPALFHLVELEGS
jgi:hypothetical protein